MTKQRLLLIFICYLFWLGLNWLPSLQAVIIGLPVAVLVALVTENIPTGKLSKLHFQPGRLARFVFHYIPVFWWEHVKANFEVAYRVLHPKLPICPAVVRVKTTLVSDMALTLLANSISLVPGTTTVDVDPEKGILYIHCMVVSPDHIEAAAKAKVEKFENILKRVFE